MNLAAYPWGRRYPPNKNNVYNLPPINLSVFRGTRNEETGFLDWRGVSFGADYPITSEGIALGLNTVTVPGESGETAPSFELTWSSSESTRLTFYVWNSSFPRLRLFIDSNTCLTEYCGRRGNFTLQLLRGFLFVVASNPCAIVDLSVTCVPVKTKPYVPFPCACLHEKCLHHGQTEARQLTLIACYQERDVAYEIVPTQDYASYFAQFQYYINVTRSLPIPLTPIITGLAQTYRYSVRAVGQIAIRTEIGGRVRIYEYRSEFENVDDTRYVRYYDGDQTSASGGKLIQDRGTAIQPCTFENGQLKVTNPLPVLVEFIFRSPAPLPLPYLTLSHEPSAAKPAAYPFYKTVNGAPDGPLLYRQDIQPIENIPQQFYIENCEEVIFSFNTLTLINELTEIKFDCTLYYNL